MEMLFVDFSSHQPPVSDSTELRDSVLLLQDQLAKMRKNVQDLSGQFINFQATMLDSLQVLHAELFELRQQQSHKHSHKRHHSKKHK